MALVVGFIGPRHLHLAFGLVAPLSFRRLGLQQFEGGHLGLREGCCRIMAEPPQLLGRAAHHAVAHQRYAE